MFDFAWTEIALIGVVALVAIGPKDLPVAIKAVAEMVKKARRMAGEFQTHVDEMVREANLHEVRDQFNDLRRMDIKGKILDAVDGDRTMRNTIADNPFDAKPTDIKPAPPPVPVADTPALPAADASPSLLAEAPPSLGFTSVPGLTETAVMPFAEHTIAGPDGVNKVDEAEALPAFIPPAIAAAGLPAAKPLPPAFVPPAVVARSAPKQYASPYA